MKPSVALETRRADVRVLVEQSNMTNPRVFGSALHGDDLDGSDLDLLVDPSGETSLMDLVRLQFKIQEALGVKVDLLTPNFLHPKYRDRVLSEAAPV